MIVFLFKGTQHSINTSSKFCKSLRMNIYFLHHSKLPLKAFFAFIIIHKPRRTSSSAISDNSLTPSYILNPIYVLDFCTQRNGADGVCR